MLDNMDKVTAKIVHDLTGTRGDLNSKVRQWVRDGKAELLANYVCKVRNQPNQDVQKCLVRVTDPKLAEIVRIKMEQLAKLQELLVRRGVDLRSEHGLWIPMVADPERGDTQLNLMRYKNAVTKTVDAQKLPAMLGEDNEALQAHLEALGSKYDQVQLRRDSGFAYKVAIRGENRAGGREVKGLNEIAIVLGDIPVALPREERPRARRCDTGKGAPALLSFTGRRGQQWEVFAV